MYRQRPVTLRGPLPGATPSSRSDPFETAEPPTSAGGAGGAEGARTRKSSAQAPAPPDKNTNRNTPTRSTTQATAAKRFLHNTGAKEAQTKQTLLLLLEHRHKRSTTQAKAQQTRVS